MKTIRKRRTDSKVVLVRRDAAQSTDGVVQREEKTKSANLLELTQPRFLSLVDRPANRKPFAIVRSEDGRVIRTKRFASDALLSITLPEGTEEDEVAQYMSDFGLTPEAYDVQKTDGRYVLARKLKDGEEPVTDTYLMPLPAGMVATLDRAVLETGVQRADKQPGICVVRVRFTADKDREAAAKWLEEKGVEYNDEDLFAVGGEVCLVRHDYGKDVELKEVKLDDGIVADIAAVEQDDIPKLIYRNVVETAYGQYGWGHVDFFQAMFDEEFCDSASDAMRYLWDVLHNIIFWSDLPLSDRLSLVENATGEFVAWVTALMQSLPTKAITANTVDLNTQAGDNPPTVTTEDETDTHKQETADMPPVQKKDGKQGSDADVTRTDEEQGKTATPKGDEQQVERKDETTTDKKDERDENEQVTLTRGELDKLLSRESVDSLIESKRKPASADDIMDAIAQRMDKGFEDLRSHVDKQIEDLRKEKPDGTVAVRDDAGADGADLDEDEEEKGGNGKQVLRSDENDRFRGSIFRRAASRLYGTED